jgi:hypothetical protein
VPILDENLFIRQEHLEKKNFKVGPVSIGVRDAQIAKELAYRILVTDNARDFPGLAAIRRSSNFDLQTALKDSGIGAPGSRV